jgi:hypothetical protein
MKTNDFVPMAVFLIKNIRNSLPIMCWLLSIQSIEIVNQMSNFNFE